MSRVALVDDHYAVRLGLEAAITAPADMTPVGAATCASEAAALVSLHVGPGYAVAWRNAAGATTRR